MPLTVNGLIVDRYPEVVENIQTAQQQEIHPDIDTNDDEFLGIQNKILAERFASLNELLEAVYNAFDVDKAEGVDLDVIGKLLNNARLGSASTQGYVNFTGSSGTVVGSGTVVENPNTGDRFLVSSQTIISNTSSLKNTFSVATVANSTNYTINVGATAYTYTSDSDATIAEILAGLKAEVDGDLSAEVTATVAGTTLLIEAIDQSAPYTLSTSANLAVTSTTTRVYVLAQTTGPITTPAESITLLVTPIAGVTSVLNPLALTSGRNRESDEEYRVRLKTDQTISGKATLPAIEAALRATAGVSYAEVVQNNTMATDGDGRPPKSVECVVEGATDEEVARVIFDSVAAGIATFGNTGPIVFSDDDGDTQSISFSRPTAYDIEVRITYSVYSEESFPSGGEDTMRTAVLDHINGLGIGVDVIPMRAFSPIYNSVTGVGDLLVEVREAGSGTWLSVTLPVAATEFAQTTLNDITVVEV